MSLSNSDRLRLFASNSESWAYLTCDDKTVLDEIADDYDRLQAENQRLKEACEIFSRYGLPPEDVSGVAEWNRATSILKEVRDE